MAFVAYDPGFYPLVAKRLKQVCSTLDQQHGVKIDRLKLLWKSERAIRNRLQSDPLAGSRPIPQNNALALDDGELAVEYQYDPARNKVSIVGFEPNLYPTLPFNKASADDDATPIWLDGSKIAY